MAKLCLLTILALVFVNVIATGFSKPFDKSASAVYPNDIAGIPNPDIRDSDTELDADTTDTNILPAVIRDGLSESENIFNSDDDEPELTHPEADERPSHLRQKRGLGRRLKKLGRSVDRSFRRVRDPALNSFGTALGANLAKG